MELAKSEVGSVRFYFGVGNWDCGVDIGLELGIHPAHPLHRSMVYLINRSEHINHLFLKLP